MRVTGLPGFRELSGGVILQSKFLDLFEVHIIELQKPVEAAGAVGEWIQLFNAGSMEELDMIKTKNKGIHAYVRDLGKEEGLEEGRATEKIALVCRKLAKGRTPEAIAEDLEENLSEVQRICDIAAKYAPDYDIEKIPLSFSRLSPSGCSLCDLGCH